ncbi:hypothetical protein BLGI_2240 [Brevibacillus laterosporus GI-9]|nr:hypothetical protein BLGI_2240 [Brevibacillus laterosporus GI-9]
MRRKGLSFILSIIQNQIRIILFNYCTKVYLNQGKVKEGGGE